MAFFFLKKKDALTISVIILYLVSCVVGFDGGVDLYHKLHETASSRENKYMVKCITFRILELNYLVFGDTRSFSNEISCIKK